MSGFLYLFCDLTTMMMMIQNLMVHGQFTTKEGGIALPRRPGGLFISHVTVQQHGSILRAGDSDYEVGCKMFDGDLKVTSRSATLPDPVALEAGNATAPQVLLRVYDFENDVFANTVRLGQVVELEITIRDGRLYKGSVKDCDAIGAGNVVFPVIRNYCPVDRTVSDKVYVDDQSRTTGDYYLYIPLKVFRFLDGTRVSFSCNVIVCKDDCPGTDCGDDVGMSYGRRRRSTSVVEVRPEQTGQLRTVTRDVTVLDQGQYRGQHKSTDAVGSSSWEPVERRERIRTRTSRPNFEDSTAPACRNTLMDSISFAWVIGGVALLIGLFLSLFLNAVLYRAVRRKQETLSYDNNESNPETGSVCSDSTTGSQAAFEIKYPSIPPRPESIYGFSMFGFNRF
ncbi:uncharacterized protein LOC135368366 isoform X2 [Ornithodoros turicata]|uniref:uncharacterized protein LOC135368366 isoform X2 n=1 Tax=Ornithodoros turicata TaxID=34597 RepID=UPI0031388817